MMSGEHGEITIPMDLDLKWTKEILIEQNKHLAKLLEENSKLREDIREGISLRDHFAGLAMQGFLAADYNDWDYEKLALTSYEQADAMLKERDKRDV
jgi:hypothetical protein